MARGPSLLWGTGYLALAPRNHAAGVRPRLLLVTILQPPGPHSWGIQRTQRGFAPLHAPCAERTTVERVERSETRRQSECRVRDLTWAPVGMDGVFNSPSCRSCGTGKCEEPKSPQRAANPRVQNPKRVQGQVPAGVWGVPNFSSSSPKSGGQGVERRPCGRFLDSRLRGNDRSSTDAERLSLSFFAVTMRTQGL